MKQRFIVIGMDDGAQPQFPAEVCEAIAAGRIFSGGRRHRGIVRPLLPDGAEWIDITVPLDAVFARYEAHDEVVVFASGDPLFFGFAVTIRRRLPDAEVVVYPAFNSLQTLAHRLTMPYDDMRIVSLTGRPWQEFDRALIEGAQKIGVLTDGEHTPAAIARRMLDYGYGSYTMYVGERLGNRSEERIVSLAPEAAAQREFERPNCLILCGSTTRPPLGIPEADFEPLDGRVKMITKMPVRLLTLSLLGLHRRRTMWDVGFCTGSVSIEARLQFPHLRIEAFEIRPEGERLMAVNARRFRAPGIGVHIGDFLKADLSVLPAPDAVFIGGHGGRLREIVARIAGVLSEEGTIVFNSVSASSRALFEEAAAAVGMRIAECVALQVDDHNRIEVMQAVYMRG